MKDFHELTIDVQALATDIFETPDGEAYSEAIAANAGSVALAIGTDGAVMARDFRPEVGISDRLRSSLQKSIDKNRATDPDIADQIGVLLADLSALDEPEQQVKNWIRESRLNRMGVVKPSSMIFLVDLPELRLAETEAVEAEAVVSAQERELAKIPKNFELGVDDLLQVADGLFNIMVKNAQNGVFTRKEDLLKDPRFRSLPEFGPNPASRSLRTALNQSWGLMVEWFEKVDNGHDIFDRDGQARGRSYRLRDLELLTLMWMEPFDITAVEEDPIDDRLKDDKTVTSIDFFNGVIIFEEHKVELGEPERTVLNMIGDIERGKFVSVGYLEDQLRGKFGLSKLDAVASVKKVLDLADDGLVRYYSRRKNKSMVGRKV